MNLMSGTSLSSSHLDAMKGDFKVFLAVIWNILGLPNPTNTQFDLADYLQLGPKRFVIEAFRGCGKSWVTSAFVCWLLLNNPQLNILVVSASKQRADDFSTFTLRLINEMPFLQHLIPNEKRGQRNSKVAFDVGPSGASHAPSVKSVGITGQLTGSRADIIIADDIEVQNNSATQTLRDQLAHLTKEFSAILKPDDEARIIYLGTPQTEQSIYNRLPERGYEIRIWPARYPGKKLQEKMGDRLAPRLLADLEKDPNLVDVATDERFQEDVLGENLAEYGMAGFALQFMLDTSLADAERYPLRQRDLIVMDCDPIMAPVELAWGNDTRLQLDSDVMNVGLDGDRLYGPMMVSKDKWEPYQGIIMAVDPSGRGTDETGYAVVGQQYGRLFLLAAGGFRNGYDIRTLEGLANVAKRYRCNAVIVEPNFGDGMFNKLLQPVMNRIHACQVEDSERAKGQKEARIIDSLEPVVQQHRLVVCTSVFKEDYASTEMLPPEHQSKYRLWHQFTRITPERGALIKDDRLDALAIAVHYWTDAMEKDTHKAADERRTELLEGELAKFMNSAGSLWSPQADVSILKRPV